MDQMLPPIDEEDVITRTLCARVTLTFALFSQKLGHVVM